MKTKIHDVTVHDCDDSPCTVELFEGSNPLKAMAMQQSWTTNFYQMLDSLIKQNPNEDQVALITRHSLGDWGWNWVKKAMLLQSGDYLWFSLEHNGNVEAAVVVKHPENSRIDAAEIYYVDYLAVAPWNRDTPLHSRQFKGLGTTLLKEVGKYLNTRLSYREGFSLHSLPQAETYYTRLGMISFGVDTAKEDLIYFEMEHGAAKGFIHGQA
ncbi:MAG: hypothetical protein ACRCUW_04010 [Plesiomonas shigelloides]